MIDLKIAIAKAFLASNRPEDKLKAYQIANEIQEAITNLNLFKHTSGAVSHYWGIDEVKKIIKLSISNPN